MVNKHFVDRYNIYFAYGKSKISKRIHSSAINCVMVSIVLLQVSFTSLLMLRHGLHDITLFALVGLIITLTFTLSQCFFRHCSAWSPILYQVSCFPKLYYKHILCSLEVVSLCFQISNDNQ